MTYPPPPGEPLPPPVDPYAPAPDTSLFHRPDTALFHNQPGYRPPGYEPAGYPPLAHPASPPPPATSRTTAIVLLSVAIGLVLLVGGGAAIYLVGKNLARTGGTQLTLDPTASPSSSPAAAPTEDTITIREPDTLNDLDKLDTDEFSSLTDDLEQELEGYPGVANAFGAVYGSVSDEKLIAAFAAEVDVDDPRRLLDVLFQSVSGSNQLTGVSEASKGSLGGVAQCGTTQIDDADMAVCGWADEGSIGMLLFFNETAVDVKGDFPDMREEIETVG